MSVTNFFGPIVPAICNCYNVTGPGGTVPESAAAWGCVLQVLQNLMNFGVSIGAVLITIFIAWAGVAYLLSPVNAEGRQRAKQRLLNAVLGLFIMLAAWLLIDSIMKVIYNSNAYGPWNAILSDNNAADDCIAPTVSTPVANITNSNAGGGPAVTTTQNTAPSGTCGATSHLNCAAAIAYLVANAHGVNTYNGYCAVAVRNALNAGGLTQFANGQGNAYQYGPALTSAGFTAVYTGTYNANSGSAFAYQEGDIAVFQPVPGHPNGHITMYTGSEWVSDTVQLHMASNQADYTNGNGSFTIYRP